MEGTHQILMGEEEIGRAEVTREGLYYRFSCRCKLAGEVIHRLVVDTGEAEENLGIPAPQGEWFALTKRLPISRFRGKTSVIRARPRSIVLQEDFIPLKPEEPFSYLHRLKEARLTRRDGQLGLIFPEEERQQECLSKV